MLASVVQQMNCVDQKNLENLFAFTIQSHCLKSWAQG